METLPRRESRQDVSGRFRPLFALAQCRAAAIEWMEVNGTDCAQDETIRNTFSRDETIGRVLRQKQPLQNSPLHPALFLSASTATAVAALPQDEVRKTACWTRFWGNKKDKISEQKSSELHLLQQRLRFELQPSPRHWAAHAAAHRPVPAQENRDEQRLERLDMVSVHPQLGRLGEKLCRECTLAEAHCP